MCHFFVAALLLVLWPIQLSAQENGPLSVEGFDQRESYIFMTGVAYGIGYSNVASLKQGQGEFFCPPWDLDVDGRYLWSLVSKVLTGPQQPDLIVLVALDELQRKFPCSE